MKPATKDMTRYVGTKLLLATAMTREVYNAYRGWDLPEDENGAEAGYLVEYLDGGESNHPDHDGYISWTPRGIPSGLPSRAPDDVRRRPPSAEGRCPGPAGWLEREGDVHLYGPGSRISRTARGGQAVSYTHLTLPTKRIV